MSLEPSILDNIIAVKREEIQSKQRIRPVTPASVGVQPTRDFEGHLRRRDSIRLVAEIKRASPSRGELASEIDPAQLAQQYEVAGAAAISVLTDQTFFKGSMTDLQKARKASALPVLRKDFIVDEWQLRESAVEGPADAVLLIVALLKDSDRIERFINRATEIGMACVVEVHDERELEQALAANARIIGINNRDLHTFEVELAVTERLRPLIPRGKVIVSESGILSREHVRHMEELGVDAVLVGEALVTAPDPGAKLRELLGA